MTDTIANVSGFGSPGEIDYLHTGTPYCINPQDGNWALGIAAAGGAGSNGDAFSFDLSAPLTLGASYQLELNGSNIYNGGGGLLIGISTSVTTFGTLVFSTTPATSGWTKYSATITAPLSGVFLMVRQASADSATWNEVDNFSLPQASVPEPATLGLLISLTGLAALRRRR